MTEEKLNEIIEAINELYQALHDDEWDEILKGLAESIWGIELDVESRDSHAKQLRLTYNHIAMKVGRDTYETMMCSEDDRCNQPHTGEIPW